MVFFFSFFFPLVFKLSCCFWFDEMAKENKENDEESICYFGSYWMFATEIESMVSKVIFIMDLLSSSLTQAPKKIS